MHKAPSDTATGRGPARITFHPRATQMSDHHHLPPPHPNGRLNAPRLYLRAATSSKATGKGMRGRGGATMSFVQRHPLERDAEHLEAPAQGCGRQVSKASRGQLMVQAI